MQERSVGGCRGYDNLPCIARDPILRTGLPPAYSLTSKNIPPRNKTEARRPCPEGVLVIIVQVLGTYMFIRYLDP